MHTVNDYRREHLRKLMEAHGGPHALGQKVGYTNGSFLVQMAGPAPTRNVSEATARRIEAKLGLDYGAMDLPIEVGERPSYGRQSYPAERMSNDQIMDLIKLIGTVAEGENITLPVPKLIDIIGLSLADTSGQREEHIRTLVRLAK